MSLFKGEHCSQWQEVLTEQVARPSVLCIEDIDVVRTNVAISIVIQKVEAES